MDFKELVVLPESVVIETVEKHLPEFAESCKERLETGDTVIVILHQDAFAAGFQLQEFLLLGMAIKYAGMHNREVRIIGKNHETF